MKKSIFLSVKKILVDENIIQARVATENQQWHIDNNTTLGKKIAPMFEQTEDKIDKTFYEIRFLDSFAFMASSLDKLVENLKKDGKDTNHLRQIFKNVSN